MDPVAAADDGVVTNRLQPLTTARSRPTLAGLLALAIGAALVLALAAPGAGAAVRTIGGVEYGVQWESTTPFVQPTTPLSYEGGPVLHSTAPYALFWDPKTTSGGYQAFAQDYLQGVGEESGNLESVYDVVSQFHDSSGKAAYSTTFRSAFTDTDAFPVTGNCSEPSPCLTDSQIRTELAKYITANGLPTGVNPSGGPTPVYFVFTPAGTTVCLDGSGLSGHCSKSGAGEPLCSYHSFTTVGGATVIYAVEPLTPRTGCQDGTGTLEEPNEQLAVELHVPHADVIPNDIAAEQVAMATDPLLTGWHDSSGEQDEAPDKCRNEFGHGRLEGLLVSNYNQEDNGLPWYINDEFNQAALYEGFPAEPCLNEVIEEPQFTSPNPVRSGDPVTFNATSSYIDLGVAKYDWSFGDGAKTEVNCEGRVPTDGFTPAECTGSSGTGNPNPVASAVHQYTYGGDYDVTLTVVDGGGNTASVTHAITVSGPAAPSQESSKEASSTSTGQTSASAAQGASPSGSKAPGAGGSSAPTTSPVATQSVTSRSLSGALSRGLVIHYSVNERVAGRFEVLLASSIARRLGLHGPQATGLAKGMAPQTVIGKAILVTTKGGSSSYKLKLSKATAARLRKLHKLSLTIRMVVRNSVGTAPTTVLDTVTLR
jgi:PKD domain